MIAATPPPARVQVVAQEFRYSLSRRTIRIVQENLVWAFGYNAVLIPVAAGVLYPLWGVLLSPILAGEIGRAHV